MASIAIATEDELSEAIVLRLVSEVGQPHDEVLKLRRGGDGYLKSKMGSWRQIAARQVMIVLTDLDRAKCLVEFRSRWIADGPIPSRLVFRIAVREVESWALADHDAMRKLIGAKGKLPINPDTLSNPKQTLLAFGQAVPKEIRDDLVKQIDGQLRPGTGYNARLVHWINTSWSPVRAASRSPSLAKARVRIQEAVANFGS